MMKHSNKLIHESSPYLLQHAHNPVNWYPWGDEALEKAKKEDKIILVSIGYAACHWCHVMEHESFEDEEVANLMNEHFICIKVDREERPDIDQIYMNAVQLMTGGGGWPLNCFTLPDGRPFYGGTYFRKNQWMEVLQKIHEAYAVNKDQILNYANKLENGIKQSDIIHTKSSAKEFDMETLKEAYTRWSNYFDTEYGGNQRAPKFPLPGSYQFLLRYYFYTKDKSALDHVKLTLQKMMNGGIYDQIGGGFARYSVDEFWKVPHFEKMLYDNSQLISLYSEAYQLTKNENYKTIVDETIQFVKRELTSPEFGFYSSLDADSEGVEGKYYVWKAEELDEILPGKTADLIKDYYTITKEGNWEHTNILHIDQDEKDFLKKHNLNEKDFEIILKDAKAKLLTVRNERTRPGLDDKILTSWNALMLIGLTDAYKAFSKKEYLDLAIKNANFIRKNMLKSDFRLDRNFKNEKSTINGFLDDYALTAEAFISLYQVTFDQQWLALAKSLVEYALTHFYDTKSGMFFYTSDLDKVLVARKMELTDNVIPAANSVMANVIFMLGKYHFNEAYLSIAKQMLVNVFEDLQQNLAYYANWGCLLLHFINEPFEVAILGEQSKQLGLQLLNDFRPDILIAGNSGESNLEVLKNRYVNNETILYVCRRNVCQKPVKTIKEARAQLDQPENG